MHVCLYERTTDGDARRRQPPIDLATYRTAQFYTYSMVKSQERFAPDHSLNLDDRLSVQVFCKSVREYIVSRQSTLKYSAGKEPREGGRPIEHFCSNFVLGPPTTTESLRQMLPVSGQQCAMSPPTEAHGEVTKNSHSLSSVFWSLRRGHHQFGALLRFLVRNDVMILDLFIVYLHFQAF